MNEYNILRKHDLFISFRPTQGFRIVKKISSLKIGKACDTTDVPAEYPQHNIFK